MPLGAGIANGNFGISQKRVHRLYSRNPHFSMLRPKRAGAGVVDRWQPPDWKPPPRSLDELPTTTIPGPLGKGMISGLCIARTGLKDKRVACSMKSGSSSAKVKAKEATMWRAATFSAWSKVCKSTASRTTTRTR